MPPIKAVRLSICILSFALLAVSFGPLAAAQVLTARILVLDEAGSQRISTPVTASNHHPDPGEVNEYDPKRDAANDIRHAIAIARKENKHVLLEVGGAWCIWCKILDRYFEDNPDLLALRKANYVMVKVNFSKENENKAALAKYPKAAGYPHLYVLDAQGELVKSQDTGALEAGRSYDHGRMRDFLKNNAPRR